MHITIAPYINIIKTDDIINRGGRKSIKMTKNADLKRHSIYYYI